MKKFLYGLLIFWAIYSLGSDIAKAPVNFQINVGLIVLVLILLIVLSWFIKNRKELQKKNRARQRKRKQRSHKEIVSTVKSNPSRKRKSTTNGSRAKRTTNRRKMKDE